ncbi:MAG: hypothetical protein QNJ30_02005 [Kiloniellales bacterium]|nr:hypothetical protein [Kiloniellales bacterium]
MKRILPLPVTVLFAFWVAGALSAPTVAAEPDYFTVGDHGLVKYPNVGALCPAQGPRDVYASCRKQRELFQKARDHAIGSEKLLLIGYGADWCVWCKVSDRYLEGAVSKQEQGSPESNLRLARNLAEFVAETFVVLHVDSDKKAETTPLMKEIGAGRWVRPAVPVFVVLDPRSGALEEARLVEAEVPAGAGYVGYDRVEMLKELLRAASMVRRSS